MYINRRQLLHAFTGGTLGVLGREVVRPFATKIHDVLTGEWWKLWIEDIVHGKWKNYLPEKTHTALVKTIAEALWAPEKNIHALLTQERPSGQKTDFFIGESFWQDNGKPCMLFERHTFWQALERNWKELEIRWWADLPTLLFRSAWHDWSLLSQSWYSSSGQFQYGLYSEQYNKLRIVFDWWKKYAHELSQKTGISANKIQTAIENASLMACSWWGGQILGNNYEDLWYDSVRELVSNASTVSGMTENFVRFVKNHKGIRVNGKRYTYLSEIRKSNPNWKVIGMCHNGWNVENVNPNYIPQIQQYSAKYGTKIFPEGFLYDATAGAIAGASIATWLHIVKTKSRKSIAKKIPKITRRKFLEILRNGAVWGLAVRTVSKINGLLGIEWKIPTWQKNKKTSGGSQEIYTAFTNPSPLKTPETPTKIQTGVLNPWLEENKGTVKRFQTINEAQNDDEIVKIESQTAIYRCDWLGSQLLKTLRERAEGNSQEYLYMHKNAIEEIKNIAQKFSMKAQNKLWMKEGYSLRMIITSAVRDWAYSKKNLPNSSPNSTHNTGRAFDIAERFDLITPEWKSIEIDAKAGIIWSSIRALLIEVLNENNKETLYYMREWIPPHFHCVATKWTKRVVSK